MRELIAGGRTAFDQATNSALQAVQQPAPSAQQLHQTGSPYNLQGYSTQSGAATAVGLQNFGSQVTQLSVLVTIYNVILLTWSTILYGAETWKLEQQIRNTWKVLKCGAGEGWRRSVG
jgi:hypothetical protein